jgi:hypothetical protein
MLKIAVFLILIAVCPLFAAAQTSVDREDNQSWNDVQLTVPLTKQVDVFLIGTLRFGKNVTRVQETRLGFGFVFKPLKDLSFSPSYLNITARNSSGRFRRENRLVFYARYHFPIKAFGLSHRSQFEWRIRSPRSSWRYRPSLTFDKEIPKKFIPGAKFYITEEVFYESALDKFSRNRLTFGITKTINKKLAVDVYYLRQNDGFSVPGDLNVIGTAWKIKW